MESAPPRPLARGPLGRRWQRLFLSYPFLVLVFVMISLSDKILGGERFQLAKSSRRDDSRAAANDRMLKGAKGLVKDLKLPKDKRELFKEFGQPPGSSEPSASDSWPDPGPNDDPDKFLYEELCRRENISSPLDSDDLPNMISEESPVPDYIDTTPANKSGFVIDESKYNRTKLEKLGIYIGKRSPFKKAVDRWMETQQVSSGSESVYETVSETATDDDDDEEEEEEEEEEEGEEGDVANEGEGKELKGEVPQAYDNCTTRHYEQINGTSRLSSVTNTVVSQVGSELHKKEGGGGQSTLTNASHVSQQLQGRGKFAHFSSVDPRSSVFVVNTTFRPTFQVPGKEMHIPTEIFKNESLLEEVKDAFGVRFGTYKDPNDRDLALEQERLGIEAFGRCRSKEAIKHLANAAMLQPQNVSLHLNLVAIHHNPDVKRILSKKVCETRSCWHLEIIGHCMHNMSLPHRYKTLCKYKERGHFKMTQREWMRCAAFLPYIPNSLRPEHARPKSYGKQHGPPEWNWGIDQFGNKIEYREAGRLKPDLETRASMQAWDERMLNKTRELGVNITEWELKDLARLRDLEIQENGRLSMIKRQLKEKKEARIKAQQQKEEEYEKQGKDMFLESITDPQKRRVMERIRRSILEIEKSDEEGDIEGRALEEDEDSNRRNSATVSNSPFKTKNELLL